jgi:hypothetical protein
MRKGFVVDVIVGLIFLFLIAIGIIVFAYGNNIVFSAFQNNTATNITEIARAKGYMQNTFNTFNYGFLFAVFGMFFTIALLSYYTNNNPMFIPISLIMVIISVFFSYFLANFYWDIIHATPAFLLLAEQFWVVTFIMKNLPFVTMAFDFLILLVTYLGKRG